MFQKKIFSLSIDLLRLLPYKVDKNNEEIYLDINSGILLIKEEDISFLKDEYQDIINKNGNLLIQIIKIRNKYMHEPHNIKWSMTIGNDKDYNIWFKYKRFNQFDKKCICTINICELKKIVISLNDIFNNVCKLALSIIDNSSDFIKRHPYSKFLKKLYFDTYNEILKGDIND